MTVEQVPVARLSLHPENPRRGNVAAIQDSISAHGFGVDANPAYVAVTLQRLAGLGLEPRREPVARRRKPAAKPQPAAK